MSSSRSVFIHACILTAFLVPGPASAVQEPDHLEVPLTIDHRHLAERVSTVLDMDADGRARITRDACNRVELSDLRTRSAGERLEVDMAVAADVGTAVLGQCIGPGRWHGRMRVELVPDVDGSGLRIVLTPETADLRRPDGTESLLTRPARALAETLILPRLGRAQVDLVEPLESIDRLLATFLRDMGPQAADLVGRSRLTAVTVHEDGVRALLGFEVSRPAAVEREEVPPLDSRELAQWQRLEDELDGFLTVIITHLASQARDRELRLDMLGVLLDARHAIASALADDSETAGPDDPVRTLFVESWDRLRPHVLTLERTDVVPDNGALALASFIAGADAISALDALGPEYGLELTRDGLRRLARMLLGERAPASFTPLPLAVDPSLRKLLRPEAVDWPEDVEPRAGPLSMLGAWLIADARAANDSPALALKGKVPTLADLDNYLNLVSVLMDQEIRARKGGNTRVPAVFRFMFDPLVRATAWKESCWRQYTGSPGNPRVLKSSIGALGMMQINPRVWRGVYDLDRLAEDVQYNLHAGIDILEHYMVDYAIRRGEHRQPGGFDSLAQATYAAYNGGPGHLSRYRRDDTAVSLRAIDREFLEHYQTFRTTRWPRVQSCYAVP